MSRMQQLDDINIAIASGSETAQQLLQSNLRQHGAKISHCGSLDLSFVIHLEREAKTDVILLDINDNYDEDVFELLLERVDVPVLFHEYDFIVNRYDNGKAQISEYRLKHLVEKISMLRPTPADVFQQTEDSLVCKDPVGEIEVISDLNVWILGASIGGPESVKRFLSLLPADLPVAFVLAQHLGKDFEKLLAQQLDRVSQFRVKKAGNGDYLKHGEVLVVPVKNRIVFGNEGVVSVLEEPWKGHYKPSIDEVIYDITHNFKQHTGIIILSGMGADGVEASIHFHKQYQGIVWAQESASCIVSSMPDSARKADIVSYSGSPEDLANKIIAYYID